VPYTRLAVDLASAQTTPAFGWITPNMTDDMHDGTVAQGDAWLSTAVPAILACDAFTLQQSLLFITWDENDAPGNQVPALVIADDVPPGFASQVPYTHYSLLRTIESGWGLAPLTANDAAAAAMSDFFPAG
jgi:phosphatidylinositol-3-phosphatase